MSGMQSEAQKRKAEYEEAQRRDALRRRARDDRGRLEHYVEQERNALRQDSKLSDAAKGSGGS